MCSNTRCPVTTRAQLVVCICGARTSMPKMHLEFPRRHAPPSSVHGAHPESGHNGKASWLFTAHLTSATAESDAGRVFSTTSPHFAECEMASAIASPLSSSRSTLVVMQRRESFFRVSYLPKVKSTEIIRSPVSVVSHFDQQQLKGTVRTSLTHAQSPVKLSLAVAEVVPVRADGKATRPRVAEGCRLAQKRLRCLALT